jgi:hypothetical protein
MTRKTVLMIAAVGIAALAVEWAGLRYVYARSPLASVECHATNAGSSIPPEQLQVFIYPTGRPWELVAQGRGAESLQVPPGRYDVRVLLDASADQQSRWFREIELGEGGRVVKQAAFSAGELSVTSPLPSGTAAGQLVVYVFAPDNHDQIVTSMHASQVALLASGTYDVRAVLSLESEERSVTWLHGVQVEAGVRATREVRFERGRLLVIARNAGDVLASEAVSVRVFAAGDVQEEIIDHGKGGVTMSLAHGRYDAELTFALSNDKPSRWLRGLEIVENETNRQSVDFSSGSIVVAAEMPGGEQLRNFDAYVYYYRTGDHREPVAYTPAGETAVLESRSYDVRVHFFRSHDRPDEWIREVRVEAGQRVRHSVTFPSGRLLVRAFAADRNELIGDDVFL